jgi:hypothetical protein
MAFPISGTAGQVSVEGVTQLWIKTWKLDQQTAEIAFPSFNIVPDADGRAWTPYLLGLSNATGTLEGWFASGTSDSDGVPTDSVIMVGTEVEILLRFDKVSNWGFNVTAYITALGSGTNVENQPATFNVGFRVNDAVPLSAVV